MYVSYRMFPTKPLEVPTVALSAAVTNPVVVWQRSVPEAIGSLDTLDRTDYADLFRTDIRAVPARSIEEWVREVLTRGPRGLTTLVPIVHRYVLGLDLGKGGTPENLFGWKVTEHTSTWMRLEASGWLITAQLVVRADRGELAVGTFVRYNHPLARVIWPPVSLVHRQVGIALMRQARRTQTVSSR